MQRQFGGGVFSVPSSEEPADPQGTGEYQTAVFKVTTSDSLKVQKYFLSPFLSSSLSLTVSHLSCVYQSFLRRDTEGHLQPVAAALTPIG